MYLEQIASILYAPGTESENTHITVRWYHGENNILWSGAAKDLKEALGLHGWQVVEILVDKFDGQADSVPDYNRGKIIVVV